MSLKALLVFLLLIFASPPYGAADENVCMEREPLVDQLVFGFGEQLVAVWDIEGKGLLELHVSSHTGNLHGSADRVLGSF